MSLWLLFAGHNQPGGGFVGGLVAGAAITLRYIAGGIDEVRCLIAGSGRGRSSAPGRPVAGLTAARPARSSASRRSRPASSSLDLPLLGDVHVSTRRSLFDIGVYLVVVGMVLMVFEAFGDDAPTPAEPGGGHDASCSPPPRPRCSRSAPTWCSSASSAASSSASACSPTAPTCCSSPPAAAATRRSSAAATTTDFTDPLPAGAGADPIVITFGVTALLLALAYRSWLLTRDDEVQDDVGDRPSPAAAWSTRTSATRSPPNQDVRSIADATASEVDRDLARALPIVLPLLGAGAVASSSAGRGWRSASSRSSILTVDVGVSVALLVEVDRDGPLVAAGRRLAGADRASRWSPTGSRRSCSSSARLMLLAVLVYAIGEPGAERNHVGFQSVYLVLAAGVGGVVPHRRPVQPVRRLRDDADGQLRAADPRRRPRAGALGHDLRRHQPDRVDPVRHRARAALLGDRHGQHGRPRRRIAELPSGLRTAFAVLLLVVFGIKAALFPLFFWLPDSYPTAPSPITAVFAGLLTKVGVYAIIRTQTLLFTDGQPSGDAAPRRSPRLTMVVGVLGAIAQDDIKRILSFPIVSQIGYMVMGLGLFTVAGIAAAVFYIGPPHHRRRPTLFLTGGLIEHVGGSSRLSRIGGMVQHARRSSPRCSSCRR